ncbi:MAG: S8 family serine peptidase, partial [Candidatus Krumholzibacteriia bacterium]
RVVFLDAGLAPDAAARRWAALPGVIFAEPYFVHRVAALPDDPLLGEQLNLVRVGAQAAWDVSRGETDPEPVAVVDGGIDITHADLAANVLLNDADPPNGLDDDGNGFVDDTRGWNFAAGTDDPAAFAAVTPAAVRHGTHVAGLVAAVANNGLGVAGLTWNDRVLCVAAGDAVRDDAVVFGYQGILYAAGRGVHVINCSWGRQLTTSLLEQAVLARAGVLGALVVAAAGNDAQGFPFYPAAYPGVVAVANVTDDGLPHYSTNFGSWVDLAAPGVDALSLFPGDAYGRLTGTSMASPLVAAGAALLWGRERSLDAAGVTMRLRVSAASLVASAGSAAAGLGNGRLDLPAALAWTGPGYALAGVDVREAPGNGDGLIAPGEGVALQPQWRNLLGAGQAPVTIRLSCLSPYATVTQDSARLAPLASGAVAAVARPLQLTVAPTAPVGTVLTLIWDLVGPEAGVPYRDRQASELVVTPLFHDLADGEVKATLAGNGRIGFAGRGGGDGRDGAGVRYVPTGQLDGNGPLDNLLFEGALLVATGPDRVSDGARYSGNGAYQRDFNPGSAQDAPRALATLPMPGGRERFARVAASFRDDLSPNPNQVPLPVEVRWLGLAPLDAQPPGVLLLLTSVINRGTTALTGLHYGFFLDWDLNGGGYFPTFSANSTRWDAASGAGLAWRDEFPEGLVVAAALVPEGAEPTLFRAITNDGSAGGWGIYDGFLDDRKWAALTETDGPQAAVNTDISQVIAGGPVDLAPGDSVRCVLVLAAGTTPDAARDHVAGGRELAGRVLQAPVWSSPPQPFAVGPPFPNPGPGGFALPVSGNPLAPWELLVYDLRGRLVRRYAARLLAAGETLGWDGRDDRGRPVAAGGYLLRAGQAGAAATRQVVLVR